MFRILPGATSAKLEEGNLVLCSVTKIIGTTVFIHLDEYNIDGTLSFPEVAPGRIRNIRDYAFPGKKIVCKVLKIHPQSVEVSLRRVKVNEIKESEDLVDFLESAKETPSKLDKYLSKEQAQKIISILSEKKIKETLISQKFSLSSKAQNGIVLIKNIIHEASKEIPREFLEVSYLAAGKYFIKIKTKDPRHADQQLRKMLENLETLSKKSGCIFNVEK